MTDAGASTALVKALGLWVLLATLGSPRLFKGLTDTLPETVPGPLNDAAAAGVAAGACETVAPR